MPALFALGRSPGHRTAVAPSLALTAVAGLLGAFLWASVVPTWTEAGLRAELDRVCRVGNARADVERWFAAQHAVWFPAANGREVQAVVYAGPLAHRDERTFHARVRCDADRVTGYDLTPGRR